MFLNASSRVALLPLSAAYHASMSLYSKLPQFCCRSSSLSCCVIVDELKFDTDTPKGVSATEASSVHLDWAVVPDWKYVAVFT